VTSRLDRCPRCKRSKHVARRRSRSQRRLRPARGPARRVRLPASTKEATGSHSSRQWLVRAERVPSSASRLGPVHTQTLRDRCPCPGCCLDIGGIGALLRRSCKGSNPFRPLRTRLDRAANEPPTQPSVDAARGATTRHHGIKKFDPLSSCPADRLGGRSRRERPMGGLPTQG
jgi:hypothetical protein